ncbi:Serine/threonine-protein phosphatase 7 long form homolog, partial [Linum grandiflorum]
WSKRYLPYLQEVGLLPFEGLATFTPDPHLITVLMELWKPETNTFHMYHGECSITLQDVAHLTGLLVTGDALYVEYEKDMNWAAIVEEVLGKSPGGHLKGDRRVKMGWLHDHFYSCTDVVDETQLRQYACAYMLSIIGGFMLRDRSSAYVHCQYLLAFREQRPFAWGTAVYPGCTESLAGSLLRLRMVPRVHQLATLVDGWCYCRHDVWSASPALRGGCTSAVSDDLRVGFHLL